jgi:nicotinamide-nucleotide adenylyltransferase
MARALFLGRFQPPHSGHLHAIQTASEEFDEVLVVVGSAQASYTSVDPFTAGERIEMLDAALEEAGVRNARVFPLVDLGRHAQWVAYVESLVPPFDAVVTNNPLTRLLFEASDYEVVNVELHRRRECSGTRIRKALAKGNDVSDAVPTAVDRILKRLDATRRLALLAEDEDGS